MEIQKTNSYPDTLSSTPVEIPARSLPEHLQTTRSELEQLLRPLDATLPDSHSDPQSRAQAAYRTLLAASVDNFLPPSSNPNTRKSLLTATYLYGLDPKEKQPGQRTPMQLSQRHNRLTNEQLFASASDELRAMGALSLGRNPLDKKHTTNLRQQFIYTFGDDFNTRMAELSEQERMIAILQEAEILNLAASENPDTGRSIAGKQRIFNDTITLLPYFRAMQNMMNNDPDTQDEIRDDPLGGVLRAAERIGLIKPDISEMPDSLRAEASAMHPETQEQIKNFGTRIIDTFSRLHQEHIPLPTLGRVKGMEDRIIVLHPNEYDVLFSEWSAWGHPPTEHVSGVAFTEGDLIAIRYPEKWSTLNDQDKARNIELFGSEEKAKNMINGISFESAIIHEIIHKFQDDSLPEAFQELGTSYYERYMTQQLNTLGYSNEPDVNQRIEFYQNLLDTYGDNVHKVFFGTIKDLLLKQDILNTLTPEKIEQMFPLYKTKLEQSKAK